MKRVICLVTNWYPTKENPYTGSFFKEQAFALDKEFDFIIFRYQERIKKNPIKRDSVFLCNMEKNTVEYSATGYIPLDICFEDELYNYKINYLRKVKKIEGIGRYVSERKKRETKKILNKLFSQIKTPVDVFYCVDGQKEAYYVQCLAEIYDKPYIIGEHAPVPWPGTLINDANKYAIEKANAFFSISNDKVRQLLLQSIKLPHTVYIGNMIDENKFKIKKQNNKEKTLIIVAAHSYYKNYDHFIAVINRLTELTEAAFKVMIVGYASNKGYSKNVEEFENQIKMSKFYGFTEMIPALPHDTIVDALVKADAFVMTSIQEGQPVSALEAACCGLPIFSTRCGGIEDYIDNTNGRIYELTDVEGFALGLKDFVEGKLVFNAENIRDTVVKKYGKEAFRYTFIETINMVIENDRY